METYNEEGVLNRSLVSHREEVEVFELENHKLFEELIAHQELL